MAAETSPRSLPAEIGAATRTLHNSLNRSICSRLPLCLPPRAQGPELYSLGFYIFSRIYLQFEREWQAVLGEGTTDLSRDRVQGLLRALRVPGLVRTERIGNDMRNLNGLAGPWLEKECLAMERHVSRRRMDISSTIRDNPHTLLAHAWVMYMALFNGGRWIRGELINAPHEFWRSKRQRRTADSLAGSQGGASGGEENCLSFWDFDGADDGQSLKQDFKQRFDAAAEQLTESERHDVLEETVRIFQLCGHLVQVLDSAAAEDLTQREEEPMPYSRNLTNSTQPLVSWLLTMLEWLMGWLGQGSTREGRLGKGVLRRNLWYDD